MKPGKKSKSPLQKELERESLKAFRHNIAQLKKAGIVAKKVDARSIKPSRHYKELIKEFGNVINGTVKAVKAPKYCPLEGCKTVKKNGKTILLVDVSDKKNPQVRVTKKGVSVIDRFFGKSSMDILISKRSADLLNLDENQLDELEFNHSLGKGQSFVFTIEDKKHGNSYISKMSFQSLDRLIAYMGNYQGGSGNQNFDNATVSIRIMGDSDISEYQKKQTAETLKNKRARHAAYKKQKRAKAKSGNTHNMI